MDINWGEGGGAIQKEEEGGGINNTKTTWHMYKVKLKLQVTDMYVAIYVDFKK